MSNADKPAYPAQSIENDRFGNSIPENGLTKRELIAAMCLQGLCANSGWMKEFNGKNHLMMDKVAAEVAVSRANALIEELQKEKK